MSETYSKKLFYIFLILGILGILGVVIALLITNNNNNNATNDLEKVQKSKEVTLMSNINLNQTGVNPEIYGSPILTEYDDDGITKRYTMFTIYGNFAFIDPAPDVMMAFSDDGAKWNLSGNSEVATLQDSENLTKTSYMFKYEDINFKYVTVYVQREVNNFYCYLKMEELST